MAWQQQRGSSWSWPDQGWGDGRKGWDDGQGGNASAASAAATQATGDGDGAEEEKNKRVRKHKPGPKDAAQERRELLHKQTLEIKSLREAMSDLRSSHETAVRVLKLEHKGELEKVSAGYEEQLQNVRSALGDSQSKLAASEKACQDWQGNCQRWAAWKEMKDKEVAEERQKLQKTLFDVRAAKDKEIDTLKKQLSEAKTALQKMTEAAQEQMGKEMGRTKARKL